MANEIQVLCKVKAAKGNFALNTDPGTLQFDQATGSGGTPGVISATTTLAAVAFGAVTPGYVWLRNLSTGNTVILQTTGATTFGKLTAGKVALMPKSTDSTWRVKTTSGTALVDIRSLST